jgi:hypothetical protein
MLLNLGSKIKINMSWPFFLSKHAKEKGGVEEPLEYVVSCGTQVFLTHDKKSSSTR